MICIMFSNIYLLNITNTLYFTLIVNKITLLQETVTEVLAYTSWTKLSNTLAYWVLEISRNNRNLDDKTFEQVIYLQLANGPSIIKPY